MVLNYPVGHEYKLEKNNCLGKDFWGQPTSIGKWSDFWPFKKTPWNLLFRKFLMSFNKSPDTPFNFNL